MIIDAMGYIYEWYFASFVSHAMQVEVDEVDMKDTSEPEKLSRSLHKNIFKFMWASWLSFYFHLRHANRRGSRKHG